MLVIAEYPTDGLNQSQQMNNWSLFLISNLSKASGSYILEYTDNRSEAWVIRFINQSGLLLLN